VRQRLFEKGIEASAGQANEYGAALRVLFDSFATEDRNYTDYGMRLARRLLEADDARPTQNLLKQLVAKAPNFKPAATLLSALEGRRFGTIATSERVSASDSAPKAPISGLCLKSQRPVWLRFGGVDSKARFEQTSELYRSTVIPSLASLIEAGASREGQPYYAVLRFGQAVHLWLKEREAVPLPQARALCNEAVRIFAALGTSHVALPDGRAYRFSIEANGRLWLYDLWGAERSDAPAHNLDHAKSWCRELLQRAPVGFERQQLETRLSDASDFRALAALFQ
jgi:hypothetical protein